MGIKGARVYSNALKQEIVQRLVAGERVAAVAEEAGIDRKASQRRLASAFENGEARPIIDRRLE